MAVQFASSLVLTYAVIIVNVIAVMRTRYNSIKKYRLFEDGELMVLLNPLLRIRGDVLKHLRTAADRNYEEDFEMIKLGLRHALENILIETVITDSTNLINWSNDRSRVRENRFKDYIETMDAIMKEKSHIPIIGHNYDFSQFYGEKSLNLAKLIKKLEPRNRLSSGPYIKVKTQIITVPALTDKGEKRIINHGKNVLLPGGSQLFYDDFFYENVLYHASGVKAYAMVATPKWKHLSNEQFIRIYQRPIQTFDLLSFCHHSIGLEKVEELQPKVIDNNYGYVNILNSVIEYDELIDLNHLSQCMMNINNHAHPAAFMNNPNLDISLNLGSELPNNDLTLPGITSLNEMLDITFIKRYAVEKEYKLMEKFLSTIKHIIAINTLESFRRNYLSI